MPSVPLLNDHTFYVPSFKIVSIDQTLLPEESFAPMFSVASLAIVYDGRIVSWSR